jgi:hypothetical protein
MFSNILYFTNSCQQNASVYSNKFISFCIEMITEFIKNYPQVTFEVFTAVTMKNAVFLDVTLCRSCVNLRFGRTYRLHLQGRKIRDPVLRNVGSHKIYTVPHPRRRHSSAILMMLSNRFRTICECIYKN